VTPTERMTPAQYRRETGQPPKPGDYPQAEQPQRAQRQHPEDELQRVIVQWLGYSLRPGVLVHHSPNERRDFREAQRMKSAGVMPGWPDLTLAWPVTMKRYGDGEGNLAFIEIKTTGGRLTAAQIVFQQWCAEGGVPHAVARSLDDVAAAVGAWGLTRDNQLRREGTDGELETLEGI